MTIKTADGANSQTINTNESYKGIKAGNQVKISSGTYSIDPSIATYPFVSSSVLFAWIASPSVVFKL